MKIQEQSQDKNPIEEKEETDQSAPEIARGEMMTRKVQGRPLESHGRSREETSIEQIGTIVSGSEIIAGPQNEILTLDRIGMFQIRQGLTEMIDSESFMTDREPPIMQELKTGGRRKGLLLETEVFRRTTRSLKRRTGGL